MSNQKLRVNDNIRGIYGVPCLAVFPKPESSRGSGFVDVKIRKIRCRNCFVMGEKQGVEWIAAQVILCAGKVGVNKLGMVCCKMRDRTKRLLEGIVEITNDEDDFVSIIGDVLSQSESVALLEGVDAVILVQESGVTLYDEIDKELELLQRAGIKVLGMIIVE